MLIRISLFLLVAVFVILAIFIYKLVYTYKINKRIQAGEVSGRKLVDVYKMVMIAIIAGLVVYVGLLKYVVHDYENQDNRVSRNNYAVIDISDSNHYRYDSYFGGTQLEDASYAKVYQKDANEGYRKEVIESGEYIFTVFKRTAPADSFHPDFLCFVDFVGVDDGEYASYNEAGFCSVTEERDACGAGSYGAIKESLLYIGYLEQGYRFDISVSLLDSKAANEYNEAMEKENSGDNGDSPEAEEYAISTGNVSIVIED